MKRALSLLCLLAVAAGSPLGGEAVECIPRACEGDEEPPKCCREPPCQLLEYLKMVRAAQRIYTRHLPEWALERAGDNHTDAETILKNLVEDEFQTLRSPLCPLGTGPYALPNYKLARDCTLTSNGQPVFGLDQQLRDSDGCSELMQGAWERISFMQSTCVPNQSRDVRMSAVRNRNAYQREIDSLVGRLQSYWKACSTKKPWLKDKMDEAGVDTEGLDKALERLEELSKQPPSGRKPARKSAGTKGG
jgi:hypothetical protein